MNTLVKNPFARMQKSVVFVLCVCTLFCMALGCGQQNSDESRTDGGVSFDHLASAGKNIVSKENLPEWLVIRINDYYETRPPSICKVLIYKGEWNEQAVYFIMDTFSSCLCDFFIEDGRRIHDNLSDCRATSKNWIIIYEYGGFVIDLDELYS